VPDSDSILRPIVRCLVCGEVVLPDDPGVLRRVIGFANDAESIVFERLDEFAHERCLNPVGPPEAG
jgi:hypothetical protein